VSVPARDAGRTRKAIVGILELAGIRARLGEAAPEGEGFIPAHEVLGESSPGMLLRGLRTRENLTQAQLAEALGVHQNYVSDMERGIRAVSAAMARKIERIYHVPRQVFL
jgi:DNA-binding XRE family transcriptional regulator